MLESSANWPDRDWIERTITNQYDRLENEKKDAGSHALVTVKTSDGGDKRGLFCHGASTCRKYKIIARDR